MMKKVNGFWLPEKDTFFGTRPNYENAETITALRNVSKFRTAIDVGAHCGFWSKRLSTRFQNVVSIEPIEEHFECLEENTKTCKNVQTILAAASNQVSTLTMEKTTENSGQSKITDEGDVTVNSIVIDDLELTDVDFIKIDVEGHEKKVLIGAERTITSSKPVLFIEINENFEEMEEYMTSIGYKNIQKIKYNYIWKPVN